MRRHLPLALTHVARAHQPQGSDSIWYRQTRATFHASVQIKLISNSNLSTTSRPPPLSAPARSIPTSKEREESQAGSEPSSLPHKTQTTRHRRQLLSFRRCRPRLLHFTTTTGRTRMSSPAHPPHTRKSAANACSGGDSW